MSIHNKENLDLLFESDPNMRGCPETSIFYQKPTMRSFWDKVASLPEFKPQEGLTRDDFFIYRQYVPQESNISSSVTLVLQRGVSREKALPILPRLSTSQANYSQEEGLAKETLPVFPLRKANHEDIHSQEDRLARESDPILPLPTNHSQVPEIGRSRSRAPRIPRASQKERQMKKACRRLEPAR
jgi:hypothetical protein